LNIGIEGEKQEGEGSF